MRTIRLRKIIGVVICCFVPLTTVQAQWSNDPTVNNAISLAASDQQYPSIVSDGSGGAIVAWEDTRGTNSDIYAQRINASGAVQWTSDGVAICTATNGQYSPKITSDGSGGAIITWEDIRNGTHYDMYAQRINAGGAVQWTTDGVAISTAANTQGAAAIISDGSGGAIITWHDSRGTGFDIYAQRINASGDILWIANGVAICGAINSQSFPAIESDGSSGAIISWADLRSGSSDIYAQRIDASGVVQWTADGEEISTASANQAEQAIISDGSGGAIISWSDLRSGTSYDIYAQRINSSGAVQWTANGEAICTAAGDQKRSAIISDGSTGAIITWDDASVKDLYAQRINGSGAVQWASNGAAICTATGTQRYPRIVSDGSGGAVFIWEDSRGGDAIYAQRINSSAAVQWTSVGVLVCVAANDRDWEVVTSDGSGGTITGWFDGRGSNYDIYATKLFSNGALPVELVGFSASARGSSVTLNWNTATEVNNYGFEVERRTTPVSPPLQGGDVRGGWIKTGFVEGSGTTNTPRAYFFIDKNTSAEKHAYRLKQIDRNGAFVYSHEVDVETTGPRVFVLKQNYPNPFNPTTTIEFTLPEDGRTTLRIFDVLGREVSTLVDGLAKGETVQRVTFDASDYSSGIYFSRLEFGGRQLTKRLLLTK